MIARCIHVALGAWLAAAPLVLSARGSPERVADLADGIALVLVSLLAAPGSAAGSAAIALGIWIMAAPAALAYASPLAAMNAIAVGFAAVAVALHPDLGTRGAARA